MKTLFGHLAKLGFPNLGKFHQRFFQGLEKTPQSSSKLGNTPTPFVPLRQPMGGHGNPRKEHPAPRLG